MKARSGAKQVVGAGALALVGGLFLVLLGFMIEEPLATYAGVAVLPLGGGLIVWGIVLLRRLPSAPAMPQQDARAQVRDGLRFLAVGVLVAAFGAFLLTRPVTCGDEVMKPGDSCLVRGSGGSSWSESYAERAEGQQLFGSAVVGVGALLGLTSLWFAATGEMRRRRGEREHHDRGMVSTARPDP
jgi:hypothetical protein